MSPSVGKTPVFRAAPDGDEPWLNLSGAARRVGIAAKTLRLAGQDEVKRASLTVTTGVDFARIAAAASTKALLTGPPLAPAA